MHPDIDHGNRYVLSKIICLLLFVGLLPAIAGAQGEVRLSYLGTAGWEITDGRTFILVDPYLSRLKLPTPNDGVLADDSRPLFGWDSVGVSDEAVIDAHIKKADFILITHTHLDHALDLAYIARKTGAKVIGTESTINLARASAVPGNQLLAVRGGDDLEFGVFSLRVIPSLHGILRRAPNMPPIPGPPPPEIFPSDAKPPFQLRDYVQGGTLAYFIRLNEVKLLVFGSMNYIEREVEGLRPDAALIGAMPERREIYQYTARLLHSLGDPPLVLPTHWDRFNVPYTISQQPAVERLQSFLAEVKEASPSTRVIVPEYFQPIVVKADQNRPARNN